MDVQNTLEEINQLLLATESMDIETDRAPLSSYLITPSEAT
jgi:hypothetical protein